MYIVDVGSKEYVASKTDFSIDQNKLNRDLANEQMNYLNDKASGNTAGMNEAAYNMGELKNVGATPTAESSAAANALQHYYEQSGIKVAISSRSVVDLNKGILQAKNDYAWAKAHNDQAGMAAAAQLATNLRALGGTIGASVSLADAKKTVNFETQVSGHPTVDIGGSTFAVNKKTLTVDSNQLDREDEKRKIEYLNAQASGDTATMARVAKESLELQAAGATLKSGEDTPTTAALKNYYAQADIKDAISSKDTQKLNEAILKAKNDYTWAKEHNDVAGMDAASQLAANLRSLGGTIGANVSLQDAYKMMYAAKTNTSSTTTPKQLPSTSADPQQSDVSYSQDHAKLLAAFKQFYMAQKPDYLSDKDKAESADDDMKYMSGLTNQQLYDRLQDLMSKNEHAQYYANLVQQPGFDSKAQWYKDPGYQHFVTNNLAQSESPGGALLPTGMMFAAGIMKALGSKYGQGTGSTSGGNATGDQPVNNTEPVQENQGATSNDSTADGTGEVDESQKATVNDPFDENGKLKPNNTYKSGEFGYSYSTDTQGRINNFQTDNLQLTERDGRLPHNPNTPGKQPGDHAGHLAGDRFGGSPNLDNLVSQSSNVNQSAYKQLENQWANAIKDGKQVKVSVEVQYTGNGERPTGFNINYSIDGKEYEAYLKN